MNIIKKIEMYLGEGEWDEGSFQIGNVLGIKYDEFQKEYKQYIDDDPAKIKWMIELYLKTHKDENPKELKSLETAAKALKSIKPKPIKGSFRLDLESIKWELEITESKMRSYINQMIENGYKVPEYVKKIKAIRKALDALGVNWKRWITRFDKV